MNTTAKYISELLYRYECVIVPEFGAFLTKRQPAVIQKSTHAFFPPQKLISFNSQLQHNDGLLANYLSTAENISYTDAVAKIQRYVLSLNNKMALGQRMELEGIGSFYTSVENTLQFEPTQEINYLAEAFGLHSFISPSIIRDVEVTREVYKEQVETLEETTPIAFTPERRQEKPYIKYAAIAIITLGVGGFLGLQQYNTSSILHNRNVLVEANQQFENKLQHATFEPSFPTITLNVLREDDINTSETASLEVTSSKYHIIAGAYRVEANAIKKVEKLNAKGFKARLIGVNKYGLHQVIYNSYKNRMEALKALKGIKKQQDRRAWLLVKEL